MEPVSIPTRRMAMMSNSYMVVPEPFGKSLCLSCDECGGITFQIAWEREGPKRWDKISAICAECLARKTLALPYDPLVEMS